MDRKAMFEECDKLGEDAVRGRLSTGDAWGLNAAFAWEWLHQLERARRDNELAAQIARTDRAIVAAERSATAAENAARLAACAAFISLVAILVTLAKEWGWFG